MVADFVFMLFFQNPFYIRIQFVYYFIAEVFLRTLCKVYKNNKYRRSVMRKKYVTIKSAIWQNLIKKGRKCQQCNQKSHRFQHSEKWQGLPPFRNATVQNQNPAGVKKKNKGKGHPCTGPVALYRPGRGRGGGGSPPPPLSLLVPWSWKSRAIPLLPLWAVRPVQSLSACTRVHFTFLP
jgi:hypothetical protein